MGELERLRARWRPVRLSWSTAPGPTVVLGLWAAVSAAMPVLVLLAFAHVVALVPLLATAAPDAAGEVAGAVLWAGTAYVVSVLVEQAKGPLASAVGERLAFGLRTELMAAVSEPPTVSHLDDPDVRERLSTARGLLRLATPSEAPVLLASLAASRVVGVCACVGLGVFRWWLGLALLALWLGARRPMLAIVRSQIRAFRASSENMRRAEYLYGLATDPGAAQELRLFGLGGWLVTAMRGRWLAAVADSWAQLARMRRAIGVVTVLVLVVYGLAVSFIAAATLRGELSLRGLATLLPFLALSMLVGSVTVDDLRVEWMVSALPDTSALSRSIARVRDPDVLPLGAAAARPEPHTVTFEDVHFTYPGRSEPLLDGLDLTLPGGRSTALVGSNGAGKTTVVKLLAGLERPDAGRIAADGVDTGEIPGWSRSVAVVFQDLVRYPTTAGENIAFGAPEHLDDEDGIRDAARRSGLGELRDDLSFASESSLSAALPGGRDLSGGQWQRLVLARALFAVAHGATILVLDEPTAHLDARAEGEFFDRFLTLTRDVTTLVISHRFSTVRRADTICVLDGGVVTERGSHDELSSAGGSYESMFRVQADRLRPVRGG